MDVRSLEGFEDDTDIGDWVGNGVCNDPRFVAADPRYPSAVASISEAERRDATDCLRGYLVRQAWPTKGGEIVFGDNSGDWAEDDECDDPRFVGAAMGSPSAEHILRDAADCRRALENGIIELFPWNPSAGSSAWPGSNGPDLGDNSGDWAFDGECDDLRFAGAGMGSPNAEHILRDAFDCGRALFQGSVQWKISVEQ